MDKNNLTLIPESAQPLYIRTRDASAVVREYFLQLNMMYSNGFVAELREKLTLSLIGLIQRETSIAYRRGYHDAWKDHERLHLDGENTHQPE